MREEKRAVSRINSFSSAYIYNISKYYCERPAEKGWIGEMR